MVESFEIEVEVNSFRIYNWTTEMKTSFLAL